MCLNPFSIVNPTKYVSKDYPQPYIIDVNCGNCAECQQQKRSEWYLRTYYEAYDTLVSGVNHPYVLFDTLTYNDRCLPYISSVCGVDVPKLVDFPCFDYSQIQRFLKSLRKEVNKYIDVKFNLRYFICSEYGTDPTKTHRPHYHVLFFVRDGSLDPLLLSQMISKHWSFGRTDGVQYRGRPYVLNECVFRSMDASTLRAANYVAKYVGKSSTFRYEINRRIKTVYSHLTSDKPQSYHNSSDGKLLYRSLVRKCNQFHRQSVGYGLSYFKFNSADEMFGNGYCRVQVPSSQVVSVIPIPMYFKRKYLYDLSKIDGVYRWYFNKRGVDYKRDRYIDSHRLLTNRLSVFVDHASKLADYLLLHRGRIRSSGDVFVSTSDLLDSNLVFNYVTQRDFDHFQNRFVTDNYCGTFQTGYDVVVGDYVSINDFKRELQFLPFYESLYKRYKDLIKPINVAKQRSADHIDDLRNRLKCTGMRL